MIISATPRLSCIRCGTCCKKGGPSFHQEDKFLLDTGIILLKFLYTIREGEPVYNNIKGCFEFAQTDIIRTKGIGDTPVCIFFDERANRCSIYPNRPLECRLLKCWDTRAIEQAYEQNRLTRSEVLSESPGLKSLMEEHQRRCAYPELERLVREYSVSKSGTAYNAIQEMFHYDREIRVLTVERTGLDVQLMEFLFGRPLTTIRLSSGKVVQNS